MEPEQPELMYLNPETPPFEKCMELIKASIEGLEITTQFVKLPQVEKVIDYMKKVQELFPPSYVSFVAQNYPPKSEAEYFLKLTDKVTWKLSVEVIEREVPKANKKWYRLFTNSK